MDLALDSLTGYTWVHHGALGSGTFPTTDYAWARDQYLRVYQDELSQLPLPYFPNSTIAWDNSPRAVADYPWDAPAPHVVNPVIVNNTPAAFQEATRMLLEQMASSALQPRVLTVNAWNEWPEGSCLEPEALYGDGYLRAVRDLVGPRP